MMDIIQGYTEPTKEELDTLKNRIAVQNGIRLLCCINYKDNESGIFSYEEILEIGLRLTEENDDPDKELLESFIKKEFPAHDYDITRTDNMFFDVSARLTSEKMEPGMIMNFKINAI